MKKIGYIYKYNPSEGMGILVYGCWKIESRVVWMYSKIQDTPILFSVNDLLSEVRTGQLVYFDFDSDAHTASNIERASLSNFKVEVINSIIRCGEYESEYSFYSDKAFIYYECLDNIIIPNEGTCKPDSEKNAYYEKLSSFENSCDEDLDLLDEDDLYTLYTNTNETSTNLPESITELFNCFGKYKHKRKEESTSLSIFDLSFWMDQDVLDNEYYGKK